MIRIIIKKNSITGWVEMPLIAGALNSIRAEQFLNKNEMVRFTIQELKINEKRILRFLEECPEDELTCNDLNPRIKALIRWINDSYGLLLPQNKNAQAADVCHGVWEKLHYKKSSTSPIAVKSIGLIL